MRRFFICMRLGVAHGIADAARPVGPYAGGDSDGGGRRMKMMCQEPCAAPAFGRA